MDSDQWENFVRAMELQESASSDDISALSRVRQALLDAPPDVDPKRMEQLAQVAGDLGSSQRESLGKVFPEFVNDLRNMGYEDPQAMLNVMIAGRDFLKPQQKIEPQNKLNK
jgi:hypothetical protein